MRPACAIRFAVLALPTQYLSNILIGYQSSPHLSRRNNMNRPDESTQFKAPAAGKLVFERQGEFARELLCFMFETGAMADVEVITDDCASLRSHVEVLVRVSGYFKRTLQQGMNLVSTLSSNFLNSNTRGRSLKLHKVYDRRVNHE